MPSSPSSFFYVVYTLKEVLFIIDFPHIPFNTGRALSYGLNWALAGRGVVVNDKAFQNLTTSELQQKGATIAGELLTYRLSSLLCSFLLIYHSRVFIYFIFFLFLMLESLSGLPVYVRGNLLGGSSDISKAQYAKLLKQACYNCI